MSELFVDPDSLTATAEVASRQRDHLQRVSDYIAGPCSQFGAFQGVLNLFEGQYREAVNSAHQGMVDSMTVASKVDEVTRASRVDYLTTDREAYERFKDLLGDQGSLPPYVAPGSGQTTPGAPGSAPGDPAGPAPGEDGGLPGVPPWASTPFHRISETDGAGDVPWYVDPKDAAKDGILAHVRDHQVRQDYLDLREQGYPPAEAYSRATQTPDSIASDHAYSTIEDRARDAYQGAYDDAIDGGATPDQARDAGNDAAADSRRTDGADVRHRNQVLDDGRTYSDVYDGVNEAVDHVRSIDDGLDQLGETTDDLDDYDDYEDEPEDRSAQDWATR